MRTNFSRVMLALAWLALAAFAQEPGKEAGTAGQRGLPGIPSGESSASIPAGTKIPVRLKAALNSGTAKTGQSWEGVVEHDTMAGTRTIKAGTPVKGTITEAKSAGGRSAIRIELASVGNSRVQSAPIAGKEAGSGKDSGFAADAPVTFTVTASPQKK